MPNPNPTPNPNPNPDSDPNPDPNPSPSPNPNPNPDPNPNPNPMLALCHVGAVYLHEDGPLGASAQWRGEGCWLWQEAACGHGGARTW